MRRLMLLLLALLAVLAVAIAIVVATHDWNATRPWIEQTASAALGRAVTIEGDIEPRLSLVPTLRAQKVHLSSTPDPTGAMLAEFDHFELSFPLVPLVLDRRFELRSISASDGRVVIPKSSPSAGGGEPSVPLAWLASLPAALHVDNVSIALGADYGDLLIERGSTGSCGNELDIEIRRHDIPLHLRAELLCPGEARAGLSKLEVTLGESSAAGNLELDLGGKRPRLSGEITKGKIRVEDITRLVSGEKQQDGSFFEDELAIAWLTSLDLDLKLAHTDIRLPSERFPILGAIDDIAGKIRIAGGKLEVEVGSAKLVDGILKGKLEASSPSSELRVSLDATIDQASVAQLFTDGRASGHLDAIVDLTGHGRTPRALLAAMTGRLRTIHGRVDFDSPPLGPIGQGLLGILFSQKPSGSLECAVVRSRVEDGTGPIAIVLDTPDTTVAGVGKVDLRKLDLTVILRPRPRRASVGALKAPILVSGPLTAPQVEVAQTEMLTDLGEMAIFGVLDPFLLTSPFVDMGAGDGNRCEAAMEAATVEALRHRGELEKNMDKLGKAMGWMKGFLDPKPTPAQ